RPCAVLASFGLRRPDHAAQRAAAREHRDQDFCVFRLTTFSTDENINDSIFLSRQNVYTPKKYISEEERHERRNPRIDRGRRPDRPVHRYVPGAARRLVAGDRTPA